MIFSSQSRQHMLCHATWNITMKLVNLLGQVNSSCAWMMSIIFSRYVVTHPCHSMTVYQMLMLGYVWVNTSDVWWGCNYLCPNPFVGWICASAEMRRPAIRSTAHAPILSLTDSSELFPEQPWPEHHGNSLMEAMIDHSVFSQCATVCRWLISQKWMISG